MAKTGQDATIYTDNYVILRFSVVDEDDPLEPALDLTGLEVFYSVARYNSRGEPIVATPLIDVNSDGDPSVVLVTDAVNGVVEIRLTAAITALLSPRDYYHELEVVDGLGNPVVTATGNLTVLPNVVNA